MSEDRESVLYFSTVGAWSQVLRSADFKVCTLTCTPDARPAFVACQRTSKDHVYVSCTMDELHCWTRGGQVL